MSRINTNLASLTAGRMLARATSQIVEITRRLATGLRINRGADDPAGLIASETLRRRTASITAAIENGERATQFINIAEGALHEVSALLLEIKALTEQAANEGALTRREIEANQEQVDQAISAITRIADTTTFAGKTILNGSRGYTLSGIGDMVVPVDSVRVDHALVDAAAPLPVTVELLTQGVQALQTWQVREAFLDAAVNGTSQLTLASDVGNFTFNFTGGTYTTQDIVDDINLLTGTTGVEATYVSDTQIAFNSQNYGPAASLTVTADQPAAAFWRQSASFLTNVEGEWRLRVSSNLGSELLVFDGPQTPAAIVAAVNAVAGDTGANAVYRDNEFSFVSQAAGPTATVSVTVEPRVYLNDSDATTTFTAYGGIGAPAVYDWGTYSDFITAAQANGASFIVRGNDGSQQLSFGPGVVTPADIANAVNGVSGVTGVTATFTGSEIRFTSVGLGGSAFVQVRGIDLPQVDWADQTDFINQAATSTNRIRITGRLGQRTVEFGPAAVTPQDIVDAVNLQSGSTGVKAALNGGTIEFTPLTYGPTETLAIYAYHPIPSLAVPIDHSEATGTSYDTTNAGGDSAISVRSINFDPRTEVSGLTASLQSRKLEVDITFADFIGQSIGGRGREGIYPVTTTFYVTGGGMHFHITPDLDLAGRLSSSLPSILPASLGSVITGYLSDIRSTGASSLVAGQTGRAVSIIDAAIDQVAEIRGELGAIDKYVIQPNLASQRIALENTMSAESLIRDADFAREVADLTRAQVVSAAANRVLRIANAQPQAALQLLR